MNMAKVRVCKTTNYTTIDNGIFKDKRLSLKAKGLLVTMLSLPEEWNYTIEGLSVILKEGKDCIRGTLNELEKCGYLVRNRVRDDKGRLKDTEYVVYEKPKSEKPMSENPILDNPTQLNKKKVSKKEENKHFNQLYSVESEFNTVRSKELDFDIVKRQIEKELKSLNLGSEENIKVAIDVFRYYYSQYYLHTGKQHTILSTKAMRKVLINLISGSEMMADFELEYDLYVDMIDRHFKKDYGMDIDYSICHFMTEDIRNYLVYEVGY